MKKLLNASLVLVLSLSMEGLILGGPPPCANDNGDNNGDGGIDLSDAIYKLAFLFQGGLPPKQGEGCIEIVDCPQSQGCP